MCAICNSIFRWFTLATIALLVACAGGCRRAADPPVTVKLLHYGWVPPFDLPESESALTEDFNHQTGMRLEVLMGSPTETNDQLLLIRKLLQQRADGPDVAEADETWLGALKDDVADLTASFPNETGSIAPALTSSYVMDGKVLAIPYQNHAGVMEYRADLLRKYGYDHPPQTWEELEAMARRIQAGERALGKKDFWGYIWPGAAEESLTCNALEWQADEGGGHIIENDGTISVNNPAAIRAWERARHWIGWISPPSVTQYREMDVMSAFESGRSAFARTWGAEAGDLSTSGRPDLRVINWWSQPSVGEAGFAAMPAGTAARVAVLGGSGLFISKYSKHPREGAALIRFVIRKELECFEEQERQSLALAPVMYDAAGRGSASTASGADATRPTIITRPTNVSALVYDRVSKAYSTAVHSVLTGEKGGSDAASELAEDLIRITRLREGPPAGE
jgi:trehalose/maltose transport system substrate-binding protein